MKKRIVMTAALAVVLGLTGLYNASANPDMAGMRGPADCPRAAAMAASAELDDATRAKLETFKNDNQALRKEMMMMKAEKKALMRGENPDAQRVAQLTGEMFDLRTSLHLKAKEAGLEQYVGMGMGTDMGQGCGKCSKRQHHGSKGMMGGQGMGSK